MQNNFACTEVAVGAVPGLHCANRTCALVLARGALDANIQQRVDRYGDTTYGRSHLRAVAGVVGING